MKKAVICLLAAILITVPSVVAGDFFKLFGCRDHIEGSGDLVTETRDLKEFTRIESAGCTDIYVTVGEKQQVSITFDDNLIDLIETGVRGKTLKVWSEESFSSHRDCRIEITVPEIEQVRLSGSGDVEIYNLEGEFFEYKITGSGDMTAEGKVDELEIKVSGSGDVDTRELQARDAYVRVSGSGDVRVFASESFDGRISGSGDIYFYGDPKDVSRHVSGSGDIRKKR